MSKVKTSPSESNKSNPLLLLVIVAALATVSYIVYDKAIKGPQTSSTEQPVSETAIVGTVSDEVPDSLSSVLDRSPGSVTDTETEGKPE